MKRFLIITGCVVAPTMVGVVLMRATVPAPTGVIYACYNKSGGNIRVIDNAVTACNANETQRTWNQTGPQGPIGPIGRRVRLGHKDYQAHRDQPGQRDRATPFLGLQESPVGALHIS